MSFRYACMCTAILAATGLATAPAASEEDLSLLVTDQCPVGHQTASGSQFAVSESSTFILLDGASIVDQRQGRLSAPEFRVAAEWEGFLTGTLPNDPSLNSGTVTFTPAGRALSRALRSTNTPLSLCIVLELDGPPQN